jgi:TonB family protein
MNSQSAIITLACFTCKALLAASGPDPTTSAVDAKGRRHRSDEYQGKAPWSSRDLVKAVGPEYSPRDRQSRNQGTGFFRLTLDLKTGRVTNVSIVKSIGITTLNQSAVNALRQWRWKPGTWKEVDVPVSFGMAEGPPRLPPGAVPLPSQ